MSLPSGYKRLEYIQSTGTQYVDSGFIPNGESTVEIEFESAVISPTTSGNYPVYGAASNYNSNAFELWSMAYGFCVYGSQDYKSEFGLSANVKYISKQTKNVLEINNQTLNFTKQTFTAPYNLLIFATHRSNGIIISASDAKLKIYFCKIYDNGTLVRDFIPCQKPDGTIGLWDDVNSVFYGNAGTGTFTAGPVIAIAVDLSEITELEYIKSSGAQYINTAVSVGPNNASALKSVIDKMILTTNAYSLDGTGYGAAPYNNSFYLGTDANRNIAYGDGRVDKTTTTSYDGSRRVFTYDAPAGLITVSDLLSINFTFSNPDTSLNFFLFAYNQGTYGIKYYSGNIYAAKFFQNGTLIRDYIAAKLADGTVGLHDKLNGLFYINAGTGTFEAGPEVGVATPENFRLSSSTETTATLAWSAVDGATGYKLYRDGALIATLTDTSYTDTIQPFTSYIYTLTAYNDSGESDPATISVQVIIPPETPSNFRAFSASMTAIALAWDAVTGADGYQLKRNGSVIYSGEGTSYTDSGLTAETAYTYTLSAINSAGSSAETTLEETTTQLILVTDRTAADVAAQNAKGTYNAIDLIRVGEAVQYLADILDGLGYVCPVSAKLDWKETDWPTPSDMERYLLDVSTLRGLLTQMETTPDVPNSMEKLTHWTANDIEKILMDIDDTLTRLQSSMFYSGELYSGEESI